MAKLIIRYPDGRSDETELKEELSTIGRDTSNKIILENEEVSPTQAKVEKSGSTYVITDLSENRNTTVNGVRREAHTLRNGDSIAFGPVEAVFHLHNEELHEKSSSFSLVMGIGAAVIVLAITIVFFFVGKHLLNELAEETAQQGEEIVSFEVAPSGVSEEPRESRREGRMQTSSPEREPSSQRRGSPLLRLLRKKRIALPEPKRSVIAERQAKAIPGGLKRLFFKRIPVIVEAESDQGEEDALSLRGAPPVAEQGKKATAEELQEALGEGTISPEGEKAPATHRERAVHKIGAAVKNSLMRVVGKRERIRTGKKETPEQITGSTEQLTEQKGDELPTKREYMVESQMDKIVEKLTEPQTQEKGDLRAFMSRFEIPELRKPSFVEGPVYSKEEAGRFRGEWIDERLYVSKRESADATLLWQYNGGLQGRESIVEGGTVGRIDDDRSFDYLFGTKTGRLVALSGEDGEEILVKDLNRPFYEPILDDIDGDGRDDILIVYEEGEIIPYTRDFTMLWSFEAQEKITSMPLLADLNKDRNSDIVFPTIGMEIVALDGVSGFELWRFFDAESETLHPPVGVDLNDDSVRDVLFITEKGFMYAVDGRTGWGLWKRDILGEPAGSCSIGDLDGDKNPDIIALTENGMLSGHRRDGSLLFRTGLGSSYHGAPSIGDTDGDGNDEIVLVDKRGALKAIEGRTRREEWTYETEEPSSHGRLALVDINHDRGMDVVLSTPSGMLFVIDGKSGRPLALFNVENYLFTTPIVFDVNRDRRLEIILADYGGDVFAVQVQGTEKKLLSLLFSLKRSFWASSNHDKHNTGHSSSGFLKKQL